MTRAYRDLFPKGDISPETGDTNELLDRLKEGILDAALVTLPLSPDGYQVRQIMHEPLVVCLRKDDPLADYQEVPPTALNGRLASSAIPSSSTGSPETHGDAGRARHQAPDVQSHIQQRACAMDGAREALSRPDCKTRSASRRPDIKAHSRRSMDHRSRQLSIVPRANRKPFLCCCAISNGGSPLPPRKSLPIQYDPKRARRTFTVGQNTTKQSE